MNTGKHDKQYPIYCMLKLSSSILFGLVLLLIFNGWIWCNQCFITGIFYVVILMQLLNLARRKRYVIMKDDILLIDTYAKMPPIESFMGVDWTAARRHFFNVSIKIKARLTHYSSRSQRYWLLTTLYLLLYIIESEL